MKKKHIIKIILCATLLMMFGNSFISRAAEEKKENSWRYKDGQQVKQNASRARSLDYDAWSKVNGKFLNDRGEVIEGAVRKGIDVSKWQDKIDWEKVSNTDVDFAIIRCGYGDNIPEYDDKQWRRNADECTRLGIPFGTYIYSYATTVEEARSEAEHVLRLVKGYDLDYPIYFDMEDSSTVGAGKSQLAKIAETFCNIITANGYEVGIYANKYWWNTYLTDPVFEKWDKWVAQYNSVCDYDGLFRIWQCASDGKVDGINGDVDINFEFDGWKVSNIKVDTEPPQPMNKNVTLSAEVNGNTEGLQYKFVWQKNNWEQWGVIREFSDSSQALWSPAEGGDYTIYMDVKDDSGRVESLSIAYKISNWQLESIDFDCSRPQVKNTQISIQATAKGDISNLEYKFVWMKDNWNKWGVIQEFSNENTVLWQPVESGEYFLYVDIRDDEGTRDSQSTVFNILDKGWALADVHVLSDGDNEVGKEVTIIPDVSMLVDNKNPEELNFKYVWMKNGWKEWGVIQDFSTNSTVDWIPENSGDYNIYVDVRDEAGNIETNQSVIQVIEPQWQFQRIDSSLSSPQMKGSTIAISPVVTGNSYALQYKFVWSKNNWENWGVIQNFSYADNVEFTPSEAGEYEIYIDVKGIDGKVITQMLPFTILEQSWYFEEVKISPDVEAVLGEEIQIIPEIKKLVAESDITSLSYKYVWMKNNWESWGILKDFSNQSTLQWKPDDLGEYTIYVDVKDAQGKVFTNQTKVKVVQGEWGLQGIDVELADGRALIRPNVYGNIYGLQYKYVWMKDNWSDWGVIQDFTELSTVEWIQKDTGTYKLYVDVRDKEGRIATQIKEITVN